MPTPIASSPKEQEVVSAYFRAPYAWARRMQLRNEPVARLFLTREMLHENGATFPEHGFVLASEVSNFDDGFPVRVFKLFTLTIRTPPDVVTYRYLTHLLNDGWVLE